MRFVLQSFQGTLRGAVAVIEPSVRELCFVDHGDDEATIISWVNAAIDDLSRAPYAIVAYDLHITLGVAAILYDGEIVTNYVAPEGVGLGVSSAMLSALERWALEERGLKGVQLVSTAAARHFYRKHGYVETGLPQRGRGVSWNFPMKKVFTPASEPAHSLIGVAAAPSPDLETNARMFAA